MTRVIRILLGLVLIGHGLVHLAIYPGADAAEGGKLFWNGTTRFGSDAGSTEAFGHALIVAVVVLYVAAGLALIVRKLLPVAGYLLAGASVLSLAAFWWMWPGLEPEPGDYWRGPVISAVGLLIAPIVVLAGRDAAKLEASRFSRGLFATWGTTADERAQPFASDARMPDATCRFWRGIDVDASAATVYRWLGMVRVAPYSYDLIDNRGRRSPRAIDDSLPALAPGQPILGVFKVAEVDPGLGFTATSDRPPPTAVTYRATPQPDGTTRLVVKLAARCETSLGALCLGIGDFIMMRKQLRTLATLSQQTDQFAPSTRAETS